MNILTFDIEDWFHILDYDSARSPDRWSGFESRIRKNLELIFTLLDHGKQPATFFCLGWIAEKYPDIIRSISDMGYEIGSHSYLHQLVYEQTPSIFEEDLRRSVSILEDICGKKVLYYRAPGFSITEKTTWAFDILIRNGIEADCSVFPGIRGHGGFSSFRSSKPSEIRASSGSIKEFPVNYFTICGCKIFFSGGGYFRITPGWVTRSLTEKSDYVMSYFHPRDFDDDQPFLSGLGIVRRYKSYAGIHHAAAKLSRLLNMNPFMDIKTAISETDWKSVTVIDI